jgi:hypothetical protein
VRYKVVAKEYKDLKGKQYDVVDTEHEDQVIVRYTKKGEADKHAAELEKNPPEDQPVIVG